MDDQASKRDFAGKSGYRCALTVFFAHSSILEI
jgi:hypothetical protein